MKRLIAALVLCATTTTAEEWKPTCPDYVATLTNKSDTFDRTIFARQATYQGMIRGYNMALGTSDREVTWAEVMTICFKAPETDFRTALRAAMAGPTPNWLKDR
ncbi:hypothetical protein [Tritonibacter mobilis]|uniref:hypothetical protein n=1 Tax=Tritonibacter mobilis TaxID=379347 RepID=UPI0008068D39|nr:hypothetical protein [Tritonibacter mobilis]